MIQNREPRFKYLRQLALGLICATGLLVGYNKPANALCYAASPSAMEPWWSTGGPGTGPNFSAQMITYFNVTLYQNYFVNDFYQNHIVNELWEGNIRPSLQRMTGQLIGANVDMVGAVGGFMDAQNVTETQLAMKTLQAQAIKDYTPGENLCRFGTGVRSLAAAQEKENLNNMALAKINQDRFLGSVGTSSAGGPAMDREARLDIFRRLYCDPGDNNGRLSQICETSGSPVSVPRRFNKDIDLAATVDSKLTLDLDFTDGTSTDDEQDVLALSHNLYAPETLRQLPQGIFNDRQGDPNNLIYLDQRQIAALHSVAQNSFDTIVAMRGRGAGGSSDYLRNALKEMGMSDSEAQRYLAGSTSGTGSSEPSYYAQMEILTKKLYQNPNFYVNLVDKPANVKRQLASMKGFELMQNRDIFESMQRQEMLMSLLLELEVRDEQESVQRDIEGMAKN